MKFLKILKILIPGIILTITMRGVMFIGMLLISIPRMKLYIPQDVKESLYLWCREIEDREGWVWINSIPQSGSHGDPQPGG